MGSTIVASSVEEWLSFSVIAWTARIADGSPVGNIDASTTDQTPASLRRRITPIGRTALAAAWSMVGLAEGPRIIFSSRHGEYARSYGLLQSIAESGEVSPSEFSLSVHHALVGLLSIATVNRAGHTAIAAGPESFGYGLLEAVASANDDGGPVLFVHFDAPLPDAYETVAAFFPEPAVVGLLITPSHRGAGEEMALAVGPAAGNGCAGGESLAVHFVDFLNGRSPDGEAEGERLRWRWRRAA